MSVKASEFVKRQTAYSHYSHFEVRCANGNSYKAPWVILEKLVDEGVEVWKPIPNRPGVWRLELEPHIELSAEEVGEEIEVQFYSSVMNLTESTRLTASVVKRLEGEQPYIQVLAAGFHGKEKAKAADIILYSKETLLASGDPVTGADYDIISINCRVTEEPEPPHPTTMARNFLGLPGGSPASYTAQEFAEAIQYWSTRCMTAGKL